MLRLIPITIVLLAIVAPVRAQRAADDSRSIGRTNYGQLEHGVRLGNSRLLYVKRGSEGSRHGTEELVQLIERAARSVYRRHPNTPRLAVGDISRRQGGSLFPHRSHRSGRDADVGFYFQDTDGNPADPGRWLEVGFDGRAETPDGRAFVFDAERTWNLLAAMFSDTEAEVQYIFVAPYIREFLLAEAERQGAHQDLVDRMRLVSSPRHRTEGHRNHFHVRVYCSMADRPSCIDEPPFHFWYDYDADADPVWIADSRATAQRMLDRARAAQVEDREDRARDRARAEALERRRLEFVARRTERRRVLSERRAAAQARAVEARGRARARAESRRAAAEHQRSQARARALDLRDRARGVREERAQRARQAAEERQAALVARRERSTRERERLSRMSAGERRAHVQAQAVERARVEAAERAERVRVVQERRRVEDERETRERLVARARFEAVQQARAARQQEQREQVRARIRQRQQEQAEDRERRRAAYRAHREEREREERARQEEQRRRWLERRQQT